MHSIMRVRVLEISFLTDNLYYIRAKTELQKISTTSCEKNPRKNVRLNSDREYLKQLEATLALQQDGNAGDVVLRYISSGGGLQFSLASYLSREKINSTVKSTVEFLKEREDFWDAFD